MMYDVDLDPETIRRCEISRYLSQAFDRFEPLIVDRREAVKHNRAERLHVGELTWQFRYDMQETLERELEAADESAWPSLVRDFLERNANDEAIDFYIRSQEIAALARQFSR